MSRDTRLFLMLAPAALAAQWLLLGTHDIPKQVGLALSHLFLLYVGLVFVRAESNRRFALYLAGYALIFLLTSGYDQKELLLMVFALLYAATFHSPLLFGYLLIFYFSFVLFPLYAFAEFVMGILLYTGAYAVVRGRQGFFITASFLWGSLLIVFLLLPLLHLLSQTSVQDVASTWSSGLEVRAAIWRSLGTSTVATLVAAALGIPFAYAVARVEFAGKSMLLTMLDVPILIPQPIIALALLQFMGEKTTLGRWLEQATGLRFAGSLAGIIAAQVVVSSPFLVRAAIAAFQEVNPRLEKVARTLGASPFHAFRLVALPLADRGLVIGLILAWSRSISEFGSVLILAEHPETAPVMVYHLFLRHGLKEQTLSAVVLLVLICLWIFIGLHLVRGFWGERIHGGARLGHPDSD